MTKSSKTLKEIEILNENFTDLDYQKYLNGELKLKDVYIKYSCTQNSLMYIFKERGYITRREYLKTSINENIFDSINTKEAAYLLGFYIADGNISGNYFKIALNKKDKETLEILKNIIAPNYRLLFMPERINKRGIKSNSMCSFQLYNKHISDVLNSYNFGKNKTYNSKSVNKIVPNNFMWHFIRGYFDGDGCISKSDTIKRHTTKDGKLKEYHHNNIGWTIISKDKLILEELNLFMNNSGVNTYIYPDSKGNFLLGTHKLQEIQKIYKYLYKDSTNLKMERKFKKFTEIMEIPC